MNKNEDWLKRSLNKILKEQVKDNSISLAFENWKRICKETQEEQEEQDPVNTLIENINVNVYLIIKNLTRKYFFLSLAAQTCLTLILYLLLK